ncbi:THUMP domain-containing protein [Nanoarchaeota archaeon]
MNLKNRPCIVCCYSEIALKGKNRHIFEARLIRNIKECLSRNKIEAEIKKLRGRIIIYTDDPKVTQHIRRVFGLSSISPAIEISSDLSTISEFLPEYTRTHLSDQKTFRITTKRPNKNFPSTSDSISYNLGAIIADKFNLKVNLKNPDLNLHIEIHRSTFIYHEKIPCQGGLPVGISGKIACLINNQNDFLAPWLLMKRGCRVAILSQDTQDTSFLSQYDYGAPVTITNNVTIEDINEFIQENNCLALAVPDTLETFQPEKYQDIDIVILTPLIAYTDSKINQSIDELKND